MMSRSLMEAIVELGATAGRQEVLMAKHEARSPETVLGFGHRQSFDRVLSQHPGEGSTWEEAWSLFSTVYAHAIGNCQKAIEGTW